MEETVFAVVGDVEIVVAVVVVIADAYTLAPAGYVQSSSFGDVGECAVVVVVIKVAGVGRAVARIGVKHAAINEEDVGPAVVIVVEDGDTAAGGLEDVLLNRWVTVNIEHRQAGGLSDIG